MGGGGRDILWISDGRHCRNFRPVKCFRRFPFDRLAQCGHSDHISSCFLQVWSERLSPQLHGPRRVRRALLEMISVGPKSLQRGPPADQVAAHVGVGGRLRYFLPFNRGLGSAGDDARDRRCRQRRRAGDADAGGLDRAAAVEQVAGDHGVELGLVEFAVRGAGDHAAVDLDAVGGLADHPPVDVGPEIAGSAAAAPADLGQRPLRAERARRLQPEAQLRRGRLHPYGSGIGPHPRSRDPHAQQPDAGEEAAVPRGQQARAGRRRFARPARVAPASSSRPRNRRRPRPAPTRPASRPPRRT